jgi:hypothetical protein
VTTGEPPPIIIGGCFRSGTSLLRRILDAHGAIHCGPEAKFFRDFLGDYLGDDLAHARFFSTVRSLGLEDGELLEIFGRAFIECHELAARKRGKRRWADKAPENVLYLDLWHSLLGGKFRFVHVMRHPLDTLASLVEARFDRAVPTDFAGKVEVCRRFVEHGLEFAERHPELSSTVRYEDLVRRPEETLRRLFAELGEEYEPQVLSLFHSPERQDGLEDPKVKTSPHIRTDGVGRWRRDLDPEQVRLAEERLGPLVRRMGYTLW